MQIENSQPTNARLGPIALADGITVTNALTLLLGAFAIAFLLSFLNFVQPYILTEHIGIPEAEQGKISGDLAFYAEIVIILTAGIFGAMSDLLGRRVIFAGGMAVLALTMTLYPLASDYPTLIAFRLIYAIGAAMVGTMLVAVLAAYSAEKDRGKMSAAVGILSILGVLAMISLMAHMPETLRDAGFAALDAGRYSYWIAGAIAAIIALLLAIGLHKKEAGGAEEREGTLASLRTSFRAAQQNPRLALVFSSAFCARADLVVVTTFLSVWATVVAPENNLSTAEAITKAGIIFGVVNISALVTTPFIGYIIDRIGRVLALCLSLLVAAIGYSFLGLLPDPLSPITFVPAAILGVGQAALLSAVPALLGQETPQQIRGALSGFFTFCGALGILFATKVGGELFDSWMAGAPFLLMGIANFLVFLFGVYLFFGSRAQPDEPLKDCLPEVAKTAESGGYREKV